MKYHSSQHLSRARFLLIASLGVVASAAVVEFLARVYLAVNPPPSFREFALPGTISPRADAPLSVETDTLIPDPDLLWRNRPLVDLSRPVLPPRPGSHREWVLHVNSRGFRGAEQSASGDEKIYRILCIGDAVTQGQNVSNGADYPAVLKRLLLGRHPTRLVEVINAGVADWTWIQGEQFLLKEGLALKPDLVIAAFGTADRMLAAAVTDSEMIWLLGQLPFRNREELRRSSATWRLLTGPGALAERRPAPAASPGCRLQTADAGTCTRVSPDEIGTVVYRIGELTAAAGSDLLIANLDFAATDAVVPLRAAVVRNDLRLVDPVERMSGERLAGQVARARKLGLALPRVPLVPRGRIGITRPPQGRGPQIRFRLLEPDTKGELRVRGSGPPNSGYTFDEQLHDDGAGGDERARDGVYSSIVEMPLAVSMLRYQFVADGMPEFAVPPSISDPNADRIVRFNRDSDAPIESFGTRFLMSDELHPDEKGQARIAGDILAGVEQIPSFRRFVGLPPAATPDVAPAAAPKPRPAVGSAQ